MIAQALTFSELETKLLDVRVLQMWRSGDPKCHARAVAWGEQQLLKIISQLWQGESILLRNVHEMTAELASRLGLTLLDNTGILPEDFVSINGLDGATFYARRLFQQCVMMACRIQGGKPTASAVIMLDRHAVFHTGVLNEAGGVFMGQDARDSWHLVPGTLRDKIIGVDACPCASRDFHTLLVSRFMQDQAFSRVVNIPPGVGAMGVLGGQLDAYIAYNPFHCDIAATAALCLAAGQVVCYLDGKPIDWRRACLSFPVIFARDHATFAFVKAMAKDYLEVIQKAHA